MSKTSPSNGLMRHAAFAIPFALAAANTHAAEPRTAPTILQQTCAACHAQESPTSWSRISEQRKTPEGWTLTLWRMQTMHGVNLSDAERRVLVKYLSDHQGLAPTETQGARYALERRLNTTETLGTPELRQMCARCHSAARFMLQARPVEEWRRLVNFHLGQWPSIEYSAMGRDRDWFRIALNDVAPMLAKTHPFDSPAWNEWRAHEPAAKTLDGTWTFAGHMPGKGDAYGTMTVTGGADDTFKVRMAGRFADGSPFAGQGDAILYTGYEWRASLKVGATRMRQVLMARDGHMLGRMFEAGHDERGLDFTAAHDGAARILAVQPDHIKAGTANEVTIVGTGLQGTPDFGPGIKVTEVLARAPDAVRVRIAADVLASDGTRSVRLGGAASDAFAVYHTIASLKVDPPYAVARVGGNGGSTPKVQARFDAVAWGVAPDGKSFRIGVVPAAWSVAPFTADAARENDVKFAGTMQASSGVFEPSGAGPNPARMMSNDNTGNLKVIAQVHEGGKTVTGDGHVIVAVPRWNTPSMP